jgi:menaquinol-cytochrome c reductase iron-sulfur subunit
MTARRRFLARLSLVLGAIGTAVVGIPIVGFLLAPLLRRPGPQWVFVGPVTQFPQGETVEATIREPSPLAWAGLASQTAIWLRRVGPLEFVAFSVNCTHLGCPVRWISGARLFLCPCHGGAFYEDGTVAAGPPPEPLVRYPVRVREGLVEVLSGLSPIVPQNEGDEE